VFHFTPSVWRLKVVLAEEPPGYSIGLFVTPKQVIIKVVVIV
jgi:hypothetical protein